MANELANWFSDDSAWEKALAEARGETVESPPPEIKPNFELLPVSDLSYLELFVHGYLLTPLETQRSPAGLIRILCSSARLQKRDSFRAVFKEMGDVTKSKTTMRADIQPTKYERTMTPLRSSMFENIEQFSVILGGGIAGQKSFPGEHPDHRLTVTDGQLLSDFIDHFEGHFHFSMSTHPVEKNDSGSRTLQYKYEPVREALLGVDSIKSLRFIEVTLPPLGETAS